MTTVSSKKMLEKAIDEKSGFLQIEYLISDSDGNFGAMFVESYLWNGEGHYE
ncbi:MAG: hypothetical protein IKC26_08420 [Clostridia bacterium]|nr:hypothetical protein [Clostridia bacterium]